MDRASALVTRTRQRDRQNILERLYLTMSRYSITTDELQEYINSRKVSSRTKHLAQAASKRTVKKVAVTPVIEEPKVRTKGWSKYGEQT